MQRRLRTADILLAYVPRLNVDQMQELISTIRHWLHNVRMRFMLDNNYLGT